MPDRFKNGNKFLTLKHKHFKIINLILYVTLILRIIRWVYNTDIYTRNLLSSLKEYGQTQNDQRSCPWPGERWKLLQLT